MDRIIKTTGTGKGQAAVLGSDALITKQAEQEDTWKAERALARQTADAIAGIIEETLVRMGLHYVNKEGFDIRLQYPTGALDPLCVYVPVNTRELPPGVDVSDLLDKKTLLGLSMAVGYEVGVARMDMHHCLQLHRIQKGKVDPRQVRMGLCYVVRLAPPAKTVSVRLQSKEVFSWRNVPQKEGIWFPLGVHLPDGQPTFLDLTRPELNKHVLVAGKTQHGKSTWFQVALTVLAWCNSPSRLQLMLLDAKFGQEFSMWKGLPHLLTPVATSPEEALNAVRLLQAEVERRGHIIAQAGTRNFIEHNQWAKENCRPGIPLLLVLIDEFGSIMANIGRKGSEFERIIVDMAQKALATGVRLWCSCQVPTVTMIPSTIRANLDGRVVFAMDKTTALMTDVPQAAAIRQVGRFYVDRMILGQTEPQLFQGWWMETKTIQQHINRIKERVRIRAGVPAPQLSDEEYLVLWVGREYLGNRVTYREVEDALEQYAEIIGNRHISHRQLTQRVYPGLAKKGAIAKLAKDRNPGWEITRAGLELLAKEQSIREERRQKGY